MLRNNPKAEKCQVYKKNILGILDFPNQKKLNVHY